MGKLQKVLCNYCFIYPHAVAKIQPAYSQHAQNTDTLQCTLHRS